MTERRREGQGGGPSAREGPGSRARKGQGGGKGQRQGQGGGKGQRQGQGQTKGQGKGEGQGQTKGKGEGRGLDVLDHNRRAWDREVELTNPWTLPVDASRIAAAREGRWSILLTNRTPAPRAWFPERMDGVRVLALAAGGGQQGPILAAAGARVTVLDASPRQLAQDRMVALREGLALETVEGDMADLSRFAEGSFDLVVNPASVLFVPDVLPVWRECYRVLRPGGEFLSGFLNPVNYVFDRELEADGILQAKHKLPYRDTDVPEKERIRLYGRDAPLEFSHTLTTLLAGQMRAGFTLVDLYEDHYGDGSAMDAYYPPLLATRARKPP